MGISRFKPKKIPVYEVGDIGPGGGIIAATPTSSGNLTKCYYEVARNEYITRNSTTLVQGLPLPYFGGDEISNTNSKDGFLNSLNIYNIYKDSYTYPVRSCLQFENRQKDWYLPSIYESSNFLVAVAPEDVPYGYISSSRKEAPRYDYGGPAISLSPASIVVNEIFSIENNSIWFALAKRTTGIVHRITNLNGSYTEISLSPMTNAKSIAYGNGVLIIVGQGFNTVDIVRSTNLGVSWSTSRTNTGDMTTFDKVKFGNGYFIAIGRLSNVQKIWKSTDGTTWTQCTTSIPNGYTIRDLIYNDGKWIVIGEGGMLVTSTNDGTTWTTSFPASLLADALHSINYGDGKLVIGGGYLYVSTDNGVTWNNIDYSYLGVYGRGTVKYNDYAQKWYLILGDETDGYVYQSSNLQNFTTIKVQDDTVATYIKNNSNSPNTSLYIDKQYIAISYTGGYSINIKLTEFYAIAIGPFGGEYTEEVTNTSFIYAPMRKFYPHGV